MDKKYKGIKANNSSITISFTYRGKRCRETVKVKPTKSALNEMSRKRNIILYEIEFGRFDYAQHFPNSKNSSVFSESPTREITIKQLINKWFIRNQGNWEYSTKRGYLSKITNHIEPNFGDTIVSDFKPSMFKDWASSSPLKGKTKNEVRSIMRSAFQELYLDEAIIFNPIDRVPRFKVGKIELDPFTLQEQQSILAQMSGQVRNLYTFAFWSGLRTSELIGLRPKDIDLKKGVIIVSKAIVHGREKAPKTDSSRRIHELHITAKEALISQIKLIPKDASRVFLNPNTMMPWRDDRQLYNQAWIPALKRAKVRYRTQYNTRHTYASHMLSQNKPVAWIAKQLGHNNVGTTLNRYATWINQPKY